VRQRQALIGNKECQRQKRKYNFKNEFDFCFEHKKSAGQYVLVFKKFNLGK